MTGKTHQVLGLLSGLKCALILSSGVYAPATLGAVAVFSHLMAELPDIDQPGARIWRSFPFGRVAGEVANEFLEHRNLTHSLIGVAFFGWAFYYLTNAIPSYWGINQPVLWWSGMVAYISHLVADFLTEGGIPLFYPIKRTFGFPPKPFAEVRITTDSWFENLVIFPIANLLLIFMLISNWPQIKLILFK